MSCLNINISLKNETIKPTIKSIGEHLKVKCSLVCGVSLADEPSFAWSEGVRLLWDNGELILIDK